MHEEPDMLDAIWTTSARLPEDDEDLGMDPCWDPDELPPAGLLPPPLDECDTDDEELWWWPPPAPDDVRSRVLKGNGPEAILGLCTWDKISRKSFGAYTGLMRKISF